jgi:hypothetical protein
MNNDKSGQQSFKPAGIPPNTSDDQAELLRRIRQVQSPTNSPLRADPYMRGRQQRFSERAPEGHSA